MNKKILALGQKCLRVIAADNKSSSFLGGKPLVAADIEWPRNNGKPLGFIAQLDLSEINKEQVINWLPQIGRLLFFYDLENWPWGFDPKDKGGWAVVYENGVDALHDQELPADLNAEHISSSIKYISAEAFVSYPDAQRFSYDEVGRSKEGLSEEDEDDYCKFIAENYGDNPRHQIGGFPSPIQGDFMEEECQLVSGGIYCGAPEGYSSEEAEQMRKQTNDWQLLFQFDSDDDAGAMWGDMGMIYFWVRESEAKKLDFSNSWMILQCG